jgi:hypothetical protein
MQQMQISMLLQHFKGTKALKMSDLHHLSEDQTKWNEFINAELKKPSFRKSNLFISFISN